MLLGNKCDMVDRRMISRERGEQIANEYSIRFLETSAKANINIDKAFYDLAESILAKVMPISQNCMFMHVIIGLLVSHISLAAISHIPTFTFLYVCTITNGFV